MKINKRIVIILFLIILEKTTFSEVIIAAGNKSGVYYKFAQILKHELESKNFKVKIISTSGGIENIILLEKEKANFAFLSNYIANEYIHKRLEHPKIRYSLNMRAIIGLYPEKMHILIRKDSKIESIYDFKYRKKKVIIGEKNSGTEKTVKLFFKSLKIQLGNNFVEDTLLNAKKKILSGEISGIFFMGGAPNKYVEDLLNTGEVKLLSLERILISGFCVKYPCFFPVFIDKKDYLYSDKISTFATRSLLVCDKRENGEIIANILNIFRNKKKLFSPFNNEIPDFSNVKKFLSHISIPLHPTTEQLLGVVNYSLLTHTLIFVILCILFLIILIVLRYHSYFVKFYRKIEAELSEENENKNKLTIIHKTLFNMMSIYRLIFPYLFLFGSLFLYLFLLTLGISFLEIRYFHLTGKGSKFINFSLMDMVTWMWVLASTGFEQESFPNHFIGKILVGTIPLVGMSGIFFVIGKISEAIIEIRRKKIMGSQRTKFTNHIIFYGFNRTVPSIIKKLRHDPEFSEKPIVIIAEFEGDFREELMKYNIEDLDGLKYIRKTDDILEDIKKANIDAADTIVMMADYTQKNPDAETILTIMVIERYLKSKNKEVYSIVELVKPQSRDIIKGVEVDEVIVRDDIIEKIISQSAIKPGIIELINEILTVNQFNEVYRIDIKKSPYFEGKTFDEILGILRKYNILLLGIRIMGNTYIERPQLKTFLQKHNLKRKIISNPINEAEKIYKTTREDQLFVLAEDWKVIENMLHKISNS